LDGGVFGFALAISVLTAAVFGLVPSIQVSRLELQDAMKQGSLRTGVGGNRRFRHAFVVSEITLALVLLVGAGLMVRSFSRLMSVDPGFQPEHLLTFASPSKYGDNAKRSRSFEQILAELPFWLSPPIRNMPGVQSAGSCIFCRSPNVCQAPAS